MAVGQQWYNVTPSEDHGIFLSEDNGSAWNLITAQNINHTFFNFARFNPHDPQQVYAGTAGSGLWQATLTFTTGMEGFSATNENWISVFPNPSNDKITISLTDHYDKVNITVINMLGQEVEKGAFSNQRTMQLDIKNLISGLYFVHVKTTKSTYIVKLVKE